MNRPTRSIFWRAAVCCGCLLLTLTGPLAAEDPLEIPTTIENFTGDLPDTPSLAADLGLKVEGDKAYLALEQAIALALQRNLTLVVQRYTRSQSILGILQNKGIYDYNLQIDGTFSDSETPTPSPELEASQSESQRIDSQVNRLTPLGGTATVQFNNSRSASNSPFASVNPSYNSTINLNYFQPLLRNFGRLVTERNLVVARTNVAISREDFQSQVESIIQQTSDTYWSLVESLEQLAVAEESLTLAEELHEMNRIQVEVGTKAPLEMVSSEAGVAARRQDIIRLRAQVADAADELRRLGNLERALPWTAKIVPLTQPEVAHETIDVMAAVKTALENRPDVARRKLQNDTLELDAKVALNQKQPRLDVSAGWGTSGLAGDFNDPVRGLVSTDLPDAVEQALDRDFTGWRVNVTFAYPIENRDAKARSAIADLAAEQGDYQLQELELLVVAEVRSAARGVATAAEQIESAKVSSRLAQKNLDAEQKRYENGLSTSFQVLEIQENLSEAKRTEVSAVISYRRAETAYYRAIGQLLEQHDVVLADDDPAEE